MLTGKRCNLSHLMKIFLLLLRKLVTMIVMQCTWHKQRKLCVEKCLKRCSYFDGSFKQSSHVPQSLLSLVNMILEGPHIEHQTELTNTTASLSISQLLVFNSVKNARKVEHSGNVHHSRDREMPLPLYISLKIHAVTRKKTLIDALSRLGICVSYDRVLQLTSDIGNGVCERFVRDGLVCPPKVRSGLFTTAAVDNIDYNPSSATAKDSFHGTGISLMQHPSHYFVGHDRGVVIINQTKLLKYTNVPPAWLQYTFVIVLLSEKHPSILTEFRAGTQATPPSLSQGCKIRLGTKADLLHSLPIEEYQTANAPVVQSKFLDDAAVVQMLNTGTASTFQQYFDTVFSSYITTQLQTAHRVDVVFDTYIQNSLKCTTRQKRGKGVRRRVASIQSCQSIGKTSYRLMKRKQIFVPGCYSSPN